MRLPLFKTILLWILALQLLNMSICSDAYWHYFNGDPIRSSGSNTVDPTETIVEWLVEMKMGQLDMFTYNNYNNDSKNMVKVMGWQIDLEHYTEQTLLFFPKGSHLYYPEKMSALSSHSLEIITPPPDLRLTA